MEQSKRTFTSKDGKKFELTTIENVIQLTEYQLTLLDQKISELTSVEINQSGISLKVIPTQAAKVMNIINQILGTFSIEEILDLHLVDFTGHAKSERIGSQEICIEREWSYEKTEEEIIECLKGNSDVEQVRIRFNREGKSWKKFAFKVWGYIGVKDKVKEKAVVISFEDDPLESEKTILVITMLS
ncbi:hypothetical protein J41TS12_03890 [Paenibacillus antibioticophila]|uniref:Uncharacterized protein n=1 Tax=Paenibacillus antibioticophila TaxID=1274374 RepID=A0A919XQ63_9BACL|nr:hypothetical protein [Paenibacillus antibioticophila]GIO35528.1 hypothetical protein J41TS12_03890 [Paenibacillus antibioticophila]